MTGESSMFLTGPKIVRDVTGEDVDAAELGGPRVHGRNGVCHFEAVSDGAAALLARDLLSHLPQRAGEPSPATAPADAPGADPSTHVPAEARRVYDVRDAARRSSTAAACSRSPSAGRATWSRPSAASPVVRSG